MTLKNKPKSLGLGFSKYDICALLEGIAQMKFKSLGTVIARDGLDLSVLSVQRAR